MVKGPKAPMDDTRVDPNLHVPRLKTGIVPHDTRVYLRVLQGPDAGRVFDLSPGGSYILGRREGDIPLDDAKVSRRHAEIKLLGPEWYLILDLASTNGTYLNGVRVDRRKIKHGDEILVGDTLLRLDVIEGTVPLSSS